MGQRCKVCAHPAVDEIDVALASGEVSNRAIARQYGLQKDSVRRHRNSHLAERVARAQAELARLPRQADDQVDRPMVEAVEAKRRSDSNVLEVLDEQIGRLRRMSMACDQWLQDPRDPSQYYLGPRASEIDCLWEELDDEGNLVARHVEELQELKSEIEGHVHAPVILKDTRRSDPRKLLIETVRAMGPQLTILAKMLGELKDFELQAVIMAPQYEAFQLLVLRTLEPFPEAHEALSAALEEIDDGD